MMPFRSTRIVATGAVAAAGIAVLLYGALWFVFARERAALRTNADRYAATLRAEAHDALLASLLKDTAAKRARADALFVESAAAAAFLKELERAGGRAGADITIVNVARGSRTAGADVRAKAAVEELVVTLEARGSFAAAYRFLGLLEAFPRPMALTRASFSQGEGGAWNGLFEVRAVQDQNL